MRTITKDACPKGVTWYVSPMGLPTNLGTIDSPWSLDHARTGAKENGKCNIQAGDTVLVLAGTYRPTDAAPGRVKRGFSFDLSGAQGNPITIKGVAGNTFLEGSYAEFIDSGNTAWENYAGNVWRTVKTYPINPLVGGFIQLSGVWYTIPCMKTTFYKNDADETKSWSALEYVSSNFHNWRIHTAGPYYIGPSVCQGSDGRFYIRLENSTDEAQCKRAVTQISNFNPNMHTIRLSQGSSYGIGLQGKHLVFEDIIINNFEACVLNNSTTAEDITLRRCSGRTTYFGLRAGAINGLLVEDCDWYAHMDPETFWMALADIKSGLSPAERTRKVALDLGAASNVEIAGGSSVQFFDGILSSRAHDVEVHDHFFDTIWDDSWQMLGSIYRINFHHNICIGSGISRDVGGTLNPNPDPGTIWVHHNIFVGKRIFVFRYGRTDYDPLGVGWRESNIFSTHGQPAYQPPTADKPAQNRYTIPWKFYYNTIVTGLANEPAGYLAAISDPSDPRYGKLASSLHIGQFGTNTALVEDVHEVYNNIFVVRDKRQLTRDGWAKYVKIAGPPPDNGGNERYDGNVYYWGYSQPSWALDNRSLFRLLHTSSGVVDGNTIAGDNADLIKLRTITNADVQAYYAPGWESTGLTLTVPPQFDGDYVPQNTAVHSGAVNLTGKTSLSNIPWPGVESYEPHRGARPP